MFIPRNSDGWFMSSLYKLPIIPLTIKPAFNIWFCALIDDISPGKVYCLLTIVTNHLTQSPLLIFNLNIEKENGGWWRRKSLYTKLPTVMIARAPDRNIQSRWAQSSFIQHPAQLVMASATQCLHSPYCIEVLPSPSKQDPSNPRWPISVYPW